MTGFVNNQGILKAAEPSANDYGVAHFARVRRSKVSIGNAGLDGDVYLPNI
jgi:hypothetical protein